MSRKRVRTLLFAMALAGCGARSDGASNETQAPRQPRIEETVVEEAVVATLDSTLLANLSALRPLMFSGGGNAELDLPSHVRAASGVRRQGKKLVVVQDDTNAFAWIDAKGDVTPVLLPAGAQGKRTFDEAQGNKKFKMDLEAAAILPDGRLVAFGSGSSDKREQLVVMDATGELNVRDASDFYRTLRETPAFAGAELNVEGAIVAEGDLLLLQRGNGAANDTQAAVNAIGRMQLSAFSAWLDSEGPAPTLRAVTPFDLGTVDAVPFGFTDVALDVNGNLVVLACAENSANVIEDGAVLGCRIGTLKNGTLKMSDVQAENGTRSLLKLEGIELAQPDKNRFIVVTDLDDPKAPALLGTLTLARQ